jgi:N-dimethylarginine dimethylaminohydrolase
MVINNRLEKLEEIEHARLNTEYMHLRDILGTFSEEERLIVLRANNFEFQPITLEEYTKGQENVVSDFINDPDLACKRELVEGLQRLIEKWRTSLNQREVNLDWDASSLIDPVFQKRG